MLGADEYWCLWMATVSARMVCFWMIYSTCLLKRVRVHAKLFVTEEGVTSPSDCYRDFEFHGSGNQSRTQAVLWRKTLLSCWIYSVQLCPINESRYPKEKWSTEILNLLLCWWSFELRSLYHWKANNKFRKLIGCTGYRRKASQRITWMFRYWRVVYATMFYMLLKFACSPSIWI